MRKSEIIRQRDQAVARSKSILELNDRILALNNKVTDAYIEAIEDNRKIREHAKSVIEENYKLREQVCKLERRISVYQNTKETSFQEDLEFFVNDCTEAQARELYERLKKRFDTDKGAYIRCQYNFKARVGDTVWVRFNNGSSCVGEVNSIMMFGDGHFDWFRLKTECPHLIHVNSKMVDEVRLVKEREKKGNA